MIPRWSTISSYLCLLTHVTQVSLSETESTEVRHPGLRNGPVFGPGGMDKWPDSNTKPGCHRLDKGNISLQAAPFLTIIANRSMSTVKTKTVGSCLSCYFGQLVVDNATEVIYIFKFCIVNSNLMTFVINVIFKCYLYYKRANLISKDEIPTFWAF